MRRLKRWSARLLAGCPRGHRKFSMHNRTPRSGQHGVRSNPTGACAASGWLSAQAPADFSDTADAGAYHLPVFPAEVAAWMAAGPVNSSSTARWAAAATARFSSRPAPRCSVSTAIPRRLRTRARGWLDSATVFPHGKGTSRVSQEIPAIQHGGTGRRPAAGSRGFFPPARFRRPRVFLHARGSARHADGTVQPAHRRGSRQPMGEADLVRILFEFGEEPKARRIAAAIVKQRAVRAVRDHTGTRRLH